MAEFIFDDDDAFAVYDELFVPLEDKYGPLDDVVLSDPMLMFGMSFRLKEKISLYVTFEPYQLIETKSKEGLKFALFVVSETPQDALMQMLTGLAAWFLENPLGDGDTADLSGFETEDLPSQDVSFHLFSEGPKGYALYEVRFTNPQERVRR